MQDWQAFQVSIGDFVAVVTMNRPEAKNALSGPMLVGMADAWVEIDSNDDIRCAILTGAGGTFCSGMDLKSMSGPGNDSVKERMAADPDLHWKALLRHYSLKKPLIAAVEGWAVAGGTEILQATDIRVAGEGAKFGVFEAKRDWLRAKDAYRKAYAENKEYTPAAQALHRIRGYLN